MAGALRQYAVHIRHQPAKVLANARRPAYLLNAGFRLLGVRRRVPDLVRLTLYATTHCNARCRTCDVAFGRGEGIARGLREKPAHLPLELLDRLLADPLVQSRHLAFILLMTEPLLHPDIVTLVRRIKAGGHSVELFTNGLQLPELADALGQAGLDSLHVSLNGPPELHDATRGVPGAFARAIDGVQRLNRYPGTKLTAVTTVSRENHDALEATRAALAAAPARFHEWRIQMLYYVSRTMVERQRAQTDVPFDVSSLADEAVLAGVDVERLAAGLEAVLSAPCPAGVGRISLAPNVRTAAELRAYFAADPERLPGNDACFEPWQSLAMLTDGEMRVDMRCTDASLGRFPDESLAALFTGPRIRRFRETLRAWDYCMPACRRCGCALRAWITPPAASRAAGAGSAGQ